MLAVTPTQNSPLLHIVQRILCKEQFLHEHPQIAAKIVSHFSTMQILHFVLETKKSMIPPPLPSRVWSILLQAHLIADSSRFLLLQRSLA